MPLEQNGGAPATGASGQGNEEIQMFGMKQRTPTDHQPDTMQFDYVTLADGTTVAVARGNLVAAKALLAAQKAAYRRVAAARQQRERATQPAPRHPQSERREQPVYHVAAAARQEDSQRITTPASDRHIGERELQRIALPVALPCALGECGQPTRTALIEPDSSITGLWNLLPVCEDGERHHYVDGASAAPARQASSPMSLQ